MHLVTLIFHSQPHLVPLQIFCSLMGLWAYETKQETGLIQLKGVSGTRVGDPKAAP